MAVYPKTLPTTTMPNATPTRKIFSSSDVEPDRALDTITSQEGTLAFARSKGITSATFAGRRKSNR